MNILVVGSINKDIIFYKPIEKGINGVGVVYSYYKMQNGGKGSNQSIASAKLSANVTLVGCVGKDPYGTQQIQELKSFGVCTNYIGYGCKQTGLSIMLINEDGTYAAANVIGGNSLLTPDLVKEAIGAKKYDMLIMQMEMPMETVYRTYEMASSLNIPVIFDAGPAKKVSLSRLKNIFLISPNEDEAEALTGMKITDEYDALSASKMLHQKTNAEHVVLKLGGRGAYCFSSNKGTMIPAFPIEALDSTGAGDVFTAALATRLLQGDNIVEATVYANAAGALCVSRDGGQLSFPSHCEINKFLDAQRSKDTGSGELYV